MVLSEIDITLWNGIGRLTLYAAQSPHMFPLSYPKSTTKGQLLHYACVYQELLSSFTITLYFSFKQNMSLSQCYYEEKVQIH